MKTQLVVYLFYCVFQSSQAWNLKCYNGSRNNSITVASSNITNLVGTPYLDFNKTTAIYTFGFLGKADGPVTVQVLDAFFSYNKTNVCLLNWEDEANFLMNYLLVVQNSHRIGRELGQALTVLTSYGLKLADLWLLGFSVGAHLMGDTGRTLNASVGLITGLDPSYPQYDGVLATEKPLGKDCGVFVNIHHTTKIKYGIVTATGHVDIYFNEGYYAKYGVQRGCSRTPSVPFSETDLCSHNRGPIYLAQSLRTPTDLQAIKANSYDEVKAANGTLNSDVIYVGPLINRTATGKYYINTNANAPYGKGADGLKPLADE